MPLSARAYLLERFRTDAAALQQRADSLASSSRKNAAPVPGPDAQTSRRMAQACETVAEMIAAVPESFDAAQSLGAIAALLPLLEHRAAQEAATPAVRAVYVGAATRIREVQAAEVQATEAQSSTNGAPASGAAANDAWQDEEAETDALDDVDDDAFGDVEDDDVDDDDVDDDDLPPVERA